MAAGGVYGGPATPSGYNADTPAPYTPGTPQGMYGADMTYSPYTASPSSANTPYNVPQSPSTYNPHTPGSTYEEGKPGFQRSLNCLILHQELLYDSFPRSKKLALFLLFFFFCFCCFFSCIWAAAWKVVGLCSFGESVSSVKIKVLHR